MPLTHAYEPIPVKQSRSAKIASIHRIQTFLLALANSDRDGRVLITSNNNGTDANAKPTVNLKYQLLNPAESFSDFATARSVVIAGGTMAPLSDFAQQLFTYLSPEKIRNMSCPHVVPQNHILVRAVSVGPIGNKLEFKYEQREDKRVLDEYGAVLVNVSNLVRQGIVVFFPSYTTMDLLMRRWEASGVLEKIRKRKAVSYDYTC